MSILATYREKEELVRKLSEDLRKMEENTQLKHELNFKEDIEAVLNKYERTPKDLVSIFGLNANQSAAAKSGTGVRRTRKLKVYVNPHTGERVETRGGNQKDLKAWKADYGPEVVESWFIEEKD